MPIRNILIVDDDNLFCWALQKELTSHRLNAFIANSERKCLESLAENWFDLVFLDIHLPDANGLDLLKTIRRISPGTRVAIVSWDGDPWNKETALAEGAEQFLEKPFDIGVVMRYIAGAFREEPCLRKHSRYLCNFPLRFSVLTPSPDEEQYHLGNLGGTAEDIGREGIRMSTDYPLRIGQGVRLRIDGETNPFSSIVPGGVCAEVVWARTTRENRPTAGLRFLVDGSLPV